MKIQLTEKQLKNIIIEETRTPQSLVKRGNALYKAIKSGKFNFPFFDIQYGNSQSDHTREISFKGTISYTLPDDYTIELIKDEDTFRLGIKRSGYNHIRYHINNPRFRFTGTVRIHDLDRDDVQEEHFENEPIGNIDILEYGFFYYKVFERLDKFFQQHYNVSIKRRNNTSDINEERSEESLMKRAKILFPVIQNGQFKINHEENIGNGHMATIKGDIIYVLPNGYDIEFVKEQEYDTPINTNHIRYNLDSNVEFYFTGDLIDEDVIHGDVTDEDFYQESFHDVPVLRDKYFNLMRHLNKFLKTQYNVTVKETNILKPFKGFENPNQINEDKHSSKEIKKLIAWSMKHMGCYYTESTDGIKLCPPDYVNGQCRPTHLSDKALHPMMRDIAKWFDCTKHDVERAFRGNRPI
jgi:hypothetical protein